MIHCLETLPTDRRQLFLEVLKAGTDVTKAVELLQSTGSIEHARQVAKDHAQKAKDFAQSLPQNEASESLVKLAQFILQRSH